MWGDSQAVVIQNWYAASSPHPLSKLQVLLADPNSGISVTGQSFKFQWFDFEKIVGDFDKNSTSGEFWSIKSSLNAAYLSGSNDAAIGGQLAEKYGLDYFINIDTVGIKSILQDDNFGISAQTF